MLLTNVISTLISQGYLSPNNKTKTLMKPNTLKDENWVVTAINIIILILAIILSIGIYKMNM